MLISVHYSELPEVSFQLLLFDQCGHNGADQELVGNSAEQEEAKDADKPDPSCAVKKGHTPTWYQYLKKKKKGKW